tara:strand:- start:486 stop:824 length:339 start_codon:yes stop_codon:yes gene_type:complete
MSSEIDMVAVGLHQQAINQRMETKKMGNQPNLNLLNEMGRDIFGYNMKAIEIRKVKEGDFFKRKPSAAAEYIRNHYNRKDQFGPANYSCSDANDMNREIFLKPSTVVYVEAY